MTIRKSILLVVTLVSCILVAGCSKEPVDIDPEAAAQTIQEKVEFQDSLVKADDSAAAMFYRLDDTIVDYAIYISGTGATAEEVAVLKVKSEEDLAGATEIVNKRLEDLTFSFENYRPDEMKKISNPVIISKNDTVVFVLADDSSKATRVANSLF